jgi:CHAD domain-containing protein
MSNQIMLTHDGKSADAHGKIAWISFEALAAYRLLENLQLQLYRLDKKLSVKRIHDARVAIRRWSAIWNVLRENGWESPKFRKKASEPLAHLLTHLGKTRDLDVMLELGDQLGCKPRFIKRLEKNRRLAARSLKKELDKTQASFLIQYIASYLQQRETKLEKALGDSSSAAESVEQHVNFALEHQEEHVESLQSELDSPKGMHQLRLSLKAWRYLVTEFCGIRNSELELAQTVLGEIHDLDTLNELLLEDGANILALANLKQRRTKLIEQAKSVVNRLPYGLRAPNSMPIR